VVLKQALKAQSSAKANKIMSLDSINSMIGKQKKAYFCFCIDCKQEL
jgi:hypothetical protein